MDIAAILSIKYPNATWSLDGDDYEGLSWSSDTPKPTKKQLEDLWPEVQADLQAKAQTKIEAKASAMAKLAALGLTLDEVEAAFGLTK